MTHSEGNLHPLDDVLLVQEALARWLAEGMEFKDVVNLAFHEFFERRQYLPEEAS